MKTFRTIKEALIFAVDSLISRRHAYIINVLGPFEIATSKASAVQFVAQHTIYHDGELGLTLHLPFDPASNRFADLVLFMGTSVDHLFDEYRHDGIPCFAMRFGTDSETAANVASFILAEVHGYPPSTHFKCEVYDEGAIDDDESQL